MFNKNELVNHFIDAIINRAVDNTKNNMETLLTQGPPGQIKDPTDLAISEWYLNLKDQDKEMVQQITQNSIIRTVFNVLVIIDNKIGYPIEGVASDYSLNLHIYNNQDDLFSNKPQQTIRINQSYSPKGDLHDLFVNKIKLKRINKE
jgi:hypothetical protein